MSVAPVAPDRAHLWRLGARTCVVAAGNDLSGLPAAAFEETVYEALRLGCRAFVLDFTGVRVYDTSAATVVHELEVALAGHDCEVVIAVAEPSLTAALQAAHVGLWWDVAPDVPAALTMLLRQPLDA